MLQGIPPVVIVARERQNIGLVTIGIASRNFHIFLEQPSESGPSAKMTQKHHAIDVNETNLGKRQMQCSQAFCHGVGQRKKRFPFVPQTVQKGRFVE